jgi:peptide/nickel transport system substrate-binding protein
MQLRALGSYYLRLQPVPGGTYTEGMVGSFTNASPLYATSLVDTTVSRLVFAGLLTYDRQNRLVGDLAQTWQVDPNGKTYTVTLKPHLTWHDGQPLTADDVVYTFQTIQNPDADSPLFHAWQGITVKAADDLTVTFALQNPLASFPYGLTTGIVPRHSLQSVQAAQLRSATFNTTHPIGAGPFAWDAVQVSGTAPDIRQQQIGLKANPAYQGGRPKIDQFVVKAFGSEEIMAGSFNRQEINAMVGLDHLPDSIKKSGNLQDYSLPLTAETMVFLRNDSEIFKDAKVRQAMVQAVNVPQLVAGLSYPAIVADEPILRGELGYNAAARQLGLNVQQAKASLDAAGWKQSGNEVRKNGANELRIHLYAPNNADYAYVTQQLQKAWQAIGAKVEVTLPDDQDLQATINTRQYDALLYGISIGADPDVFAYWHSSQADVRAASRLNFADYKSSAADKALEGARTRDDPSLRAAKYLPFLQAWRNDAPALALYQPRFYYVSHGPVFGFENKTLNTAADRFINVQNWMVRQDHELKDQ